MDLSEIPDPVFREAVSAIDAGNVSALERLLAEHPNLVRDRADYGEGYFRNPYLRVGVSICFTCEDTLAIYHEVSSRGIDASKPFVGNGMWVTSLSDPDGYKIYFESLTDVPEETQYSG